jgi:hypothetical protein
MPQLGKGLENTEGVEQQTISPLRYSGILVDSHGSSVIPPKHILIGGMVVYPDTEGAAILQWQDGG